MAMKKPDITKTLAEYDPTVQQMEARTPDFLNRSMMYPHLFDPRQEGSISQEKAQRLEKYYTDAQKKLEEHKEYASSPQRMQWEAMMMMAPEFQLLNTTRVAMGVGGAKATRMNKIIQKAERGDVTKKGNLVSANLRKVFEKSQKPGMEGKLFESVPTEQGASGQFFRALNQPAGEVAQGVKVGHTTAGLEGEAEFLKFLGKGNADKGYKVMQSDPSIRKFMPKWGNQPAQPSGGSMFEPGRHQEFLAQTVEESIPLESIKYESVAAQRRMFTKFYEGIEEFITNLEKRHKVRVQDLSLGNLGMRIDGSPIIYDAGIVSEITPDFFKSVYHPSTEEYVNQIARSMAHSFSPAATPMHDLAAASKVARGLKSGKLKPSAFKDENLWKSHGDIPSVELQEAWMERNLAAPPADVEALGSIFQGKKKVLPQVKGALGRETLETRIIDVLKDVGRTPEEIQRVSSTMMHSDPAQLQKFLDTIKKWRKK